MRLIRQVKGRKKEKLGEAIAAVAFSTPMKTPRTPYLTSLPKLAHPFATGFRLPPLAPQLSLGGSDNDVELLFPTYENLYVSP
jgi:hypothetical protein